jgi:hypothetical protein
VNLGRNPLLIIVALFLLLFILLPLLSHKSSSSLGDSDRALRTRQALTRVESAEQAYYQQNGHYAAHIADLVPLAPKLAVDLTDGVVTMSIDSSGDKAYLVQIASSVVSFTQAFQNGSATPLSKSCLQLKSAGSKYCQRKTSDIKKSIPVKAT